MNVLMYHSISDLSFPTSIPPVTFQAQIETLAACGYRSVSLAAFKAWHAGKAELPARSVVITFDDGFADFADYAFPILKVHGYTPTVFLPSGKMGGVNDWEHLSNQRRLMSWSQVSDLVQENVDFGGHSITHADLTKLSPQELEREIRGCKDELEQKLGRSPIGFAPPYGRARERELGEIRKWFEISVGTRLNRATRGCDRFNVPRIEMYYFRDLNRWRAYLEGRGELYFGARRVLRRFKGLVTA